MLPAELFFMKTIFLFFVFILPSWVFSQSIQVGIEFSPLLNSAKIEFGDSIWNGYQMQRFAPQVSFGPMLRFNFMKNYSLFAGIQNISLGYKVNYQYDYNYPATKKTGDKSGGSYSINYWDFPIYFQYSFPIKSIPEFSIFLKAGTRIHKNCKCSQSVRTTTTDRDNMQDSLVSVKTFHSNGEFTYSLLGGIGVEKSFKFGGRVAIALVYNQGFIPSKIVNTDLMLKGRTYNFDTKLLSTYLGLSIGFFYGPKSLKRHSRLD